MLLISHTNLRTSLAEFRVAPTKALISAPAGSAASARLALTIPKSQFDALKDALHREKPASLIANIKNINFLNPDFQFIILVPNHFHLRQSPSSTSVENPLPLSKEQKAKDDTPSRELNQRPPVIDKTAGNNRRKQQFPSKRGWN